MVDARGVLPPQCLPEKQTYRGPVTPLDRRMACPDLQVVDLDVERAVFRAQPGGDAVARHQRDLASMPCLRRDVELRDPDEEQIAVRLHPRTEPRALAPGRSCASSPAALDRAAASERCRERRVNIRR